jgi:formylglycine-generating enzyme required for sulfatase activity
MKQMKQNYKIYVAALLLVGAASMMTAGAQGSGKPTLAVFVVGMQTDALGNDLAQKIGDELNRNSRYTVLSGAADPVKTKLAELRTQGARNIDRNVLAEWGRTNGVSTICLVTDDIKGNDHMFYAHLIDAKDSKVSGRGSYIRTGVVSNDLPRVSLALSRQLDGPGRRRSTPAPVRSYPAELDIEMVFVEGGTFTMGCVPERDDVDFDCNDDEKPAHSVTLSSFYIGRYEITRVQWAAVMGGTAPADDQIPAVMKRNDLTTFFTRLNATTGKTYRLPTEAEWEYAARGGNKSQGYAYSGSNNRDEVAWSSSLQPVGMKKPNELGIYDMSGNAWEYCVNVYYAYTSTPVTNPQGPTGTNYRMRRGGSFANANKYLVVCTRNANPPADQSWGDTGFRVVLSAQ